MDDLKKCIQESLNIPVIELFEPVIPPCVTYYLLDVESALAGDGKEKETGGRYQVDVWDKSRNSLESRAKKLKKDLTDGGIAATLPLLSFLYDNNGKVWRATITFSCLERW